MLNKNNLSKNYILQHESNLPNLIMNAIIRGKSLDPGKEAKAQAAGDL